MSMRVCVCVCVLCVIERPRNILGESKNSGGFRAKLIGAKAESIGIVRDLIGPNRSVHTES